MAFCFSNFAIHFNFQQCLFRTSEQFSRVIEHSQAHDKMVLIFPVYRDFLEELCFFSFLFVFSFFFFSFFLTNRAFI